MKSPFSSLYRFLWVMLPWCWACFLALAWSVAQLTQPAPEQRRAACLRAVARAHDGWFHVPNAVGLPAAADPAYLGTTQTRSGALLDGAPYLSAAEAYAEAPLIARQRGVATQQVETVLAACLAQRWAATFGPSQVQTATLNQALAKAMPPVPQHP
jgi:hypothetical protein